MSNAIGYINMPVEFNGTCVSTSIVIPIWPENIESREIFDEYVKDCVNKMLDSYVIEEMFSNISCQL